MTSRATNSSGRLLRSCAARGASLAILVLIGLWLPGAPDRAEAGWSTNECDGHPLIDFAAVLERMRPAAHLPGREEVPFAPQIQLVPTNTSSVGPTSVGFRIYRDYRHQSTAAHDGWNVVSRLTVVRKSGSARRVLRTKDGSLDPMLRGKVRSTEVGRFRVTARPAFYRVEVIFENGAGRQLRYWNYYRVLRKHPDLRLTLSGTNVHPGDILHWRFNNFGTTAVSYGLPYEVERFDEASGKWGLDSLTPSGFPSVGLSLGPGQAGDCQSLVLPAETPDGHYRLTKEAQTGSGTQRFVSEFSLSG